MKVYKTLEKKAKLFGLPLQEFAIMIGFLLILFVINGLGKSYLGLNGWFFLVGLFVWLGLLGILRLATAKNHPSFLFSWISLYFFQPHQIKMDDVFEKTYTKIF